MLKGILKTKLNLSNDKTQRNVECSMFFSRPNLKPLNIDLISIEGGGSCPAQFWGQTADGRSLYIRYRGGHFGVECGDVKLIDACIGPGLHGDLMMEQACDLAGLTVRGKRLVLSEEARLDAAEHGPILDWSGRTTYWERNFQCAPAHALHFIDALQLRYPRGVLLEIYFESLPLKDTDTHGLFRACRLRKRLSECPNLGVVAFGVEADDQKVAGILESRDVKLSAVATAFRSSMHFTYRSWNPIGKKSGFSWEEVGRDEDGRWPLQGSVRTAFASQDLAARAFVDSAVSVAEACFPEPA